MQDQSPLIVSRRGRPKGSTKLHRDQSLYVWTTVVGVRLALLKKEGKRISVSEVCRRIANHGGLISLVGGDRRMIARSERKRRTGKRLSRVRLHKVGDKIGAEIHSKGRSFANHISQQASSIRARYYEANRQVRGNPALRKFWMEIVCTRFGLPAESG